MRYFLLRSVCKEYEETRSLIVMNTPLIPKWLKEIRVYKSFEKKEHNSGTLWLSPKICDAHLHIIWIMSNKFHLDYLK